jgi:TonB family protein
VSLTRITCGARAPARRAFSTWVPLCAAASLLVAAAGCRGKPAEETAAPAKNDDMPVAINSESPFQYPADLYDQGVEGEVRLRLFVDSLGHVLPDSTRVAASSGTPALDSAAVRGASLLMFAPAHRNGRPVAVAFYQPVVFRRGAQRSRAATP